MCMGRGRICVYGMGALCIHGRKRIYVYGMGRVCMYVERMCHILSLPMHTLHPIHIHTSSLSPCMHNEHPLHMHVNSTPSIYTLLPYTRILHHPMHAHSTPSSSLSPCTHTPPLLYTVYMGVVECTCTGRGCVYTEWVECVCMWRGCVYMEGVECVYMLEREDEGVECAHSNPPSSLSPCTSL